MNKRNPLTWLLLAVLLSIGIEIIVNIRSHQSDRGQAILARIDQKTITVSEFENHFYALAPATRHQYDSQAGRRILLGSLIGEKLLACEAEKRDLARDPEVRDGLQKINRDFPTERRSWMRDALLSHMMVLRHLVPALTVLAGEVRRYYNFHRQDYELSYVIEAKRITLSGASEAEEAQAALARGIPFAHVARRLSRDPGNASAADADASIVGPNDLTLDNRILFFMQPGQISGTIPIDDDYIILQLNSIRPATLDRAAPWIEETIRTQKLVQWLSRRPQKDRVTIDDALLGALRIYP